MRNRRWAIGDERGAVDDRADDRAERGGRVRVPDLGRDDWQGTNDHSGLLLQGASNGPMAMVQTADDAMAPAGSPAVSDDGDGSVGSSRRGRSGSGHSGGVSRGSSGSGRRGLG